LDQSSKVRYDMSKVESAEEARKVPGFEAQNDHITFDEGGLLGVCTSDWEPSFLSLSKSEAAGIAT
jgi:hypothetical protein